MTQIVCGVDVSKARLDACLLPGDVFASFDNSPEGIAQLAGFCTAAGAELVVMEASGGYERQPYLLLWDAGIACALVNARQVRCYAQAMGALEKTDRIDAHMIARFANAKGLAPEPPPSKAQQHLRALVGRLGQVTGDLTVNKQRRSSATHPAAIASLDQTIAFLKRQSKALETEIAAMIDEDPLWACLAEAWRTVKGVAGRTIARLLAQAPELGLRTNKAIAKTVGLAPIADDSGARTGQRHIRGGRAGVRSILFLVAEIARRYDPGLADFHKKLIDAGKPKMVARIALARKLLVRLNAKAREARANFAAAT
ncbi:MAG TPA: IS110 family transposase [Stellaceae bacterium]|nr:IS110 family transposase [Stellaceae bacterium]